MKRISVLTGVSSLIAAMALTACAGPQTGAPVASAQLAATKGNAASGMVNFTPLGNKVLVTAEVSGLKPNSEHGFHVHEKGDCSSGDGMSAGGHFNPGGVPHGHYGQAPRHAGDMPNLKADANGKAVYRFETELISVTPGAANNVIGRAVVVHASPDDYASQPAGNAGARMACGVVKQL